MCALGTTALKESETQIVRLRQEDSGVEVSPLAVPKSQRADQVLTSPLFGLFSASGYDVAADMERYAALAADRDRDEAEFAALGERLEQTLGPFRNDLERRIDAAVREAMEKEFEGALRAGTLTNKALGLQIRQGLRKVMGDGGAQ
jgi:hypothetical protein